MRAELTLRGRLAARADLAPATRAAMFALLAEHFEGADRAVFGRDLADKDFALLLEDRAGVLRGFSTLAFFAFEHAGERLRILVSGDTIVHPSAWGSPELARSWISAVNRLHPLDAGGPRLFWLLLTSGYRTYRFLPVFWREFHPRFDAPIPAERRELLERAAAARWGPRYVRERGIVRLERPQVLRGALLDLPPGRRRDPHVSFFADRNPGYQDGDELVSLTELSLGNLTAAGRRMLFGERRPLEAREARA